jgi:hypothetical protein
MLKYWQNPIFLKALTNNRKLLLKYSSGKKNSAEKTCFRKKLERRGERYLGPETNENVL